jgi:hypothetical protein
LDALAVGLQATAAGVRTGDLETLLTAFSDAHRAVDELERTAPSARSSP